MGLLGLSQRSRAQRLGQRVRLGLLLIRPLRSDGDPVQATAVSRAEQREASLPRPQHGPPHGSLGVVQWRKGRCCGQTEGGTCPAGDAQTTCGAGCVVMSGGGEGKREGRRRSMTALFWAPEKAGVRQPILILSPFVCVP